MLNFTNYCRQEAFDVGQFIAIYLLTVLVSLWFQLKKLQERFAKEEELRKETEEKLTKLMEEKNELFQNLQSVRNLVLFWINIGCIVYTILFAVRYIIYVVGRLYAANDHCVWSGNGLEDRLFRERNWSSFDFCSLRRRQLSVKTMLSNLS